MKKKRKPLPALGDILPKKEKPKLGRPTLYKPEYCQLLIEHMSKGYLYEAFAGVVGTCWDTLYDWEIRHPAFLEAKKTGVAAACLHDEQLLELGVRGVKSITDKNGNITPIDINPTLIIYRTKNRYPKHYRDKRDVEHSGSLSIADIVANIDKAD